MIEATRRHVLISAAMATPALLLPASASAADAAYPARTIQFIIPFAPGGGFDVYVRVVAPIMEQYRPRRVRILPMNVPAGGGARGIARLYRARPDGYTIGIFNIPGLFILQQQQGGADYDLAKVSWIGAIGEGEHYLIAAGSNSPLKTYADLKALSERRAVKFAASGPGGTGYAASLIGTRLLGIRAQMITGYKGSADYIVAAIRGDCDAVIANRTALMGFVRGGTMRILASFEAQSSLPGIPDAKALGEPELEEIAIERMVGAPPALPPQIQAAISIALGKALGDPKMLAFAEKNDLILTIRTPAEVAALVARQRIFFDKWKSLLATG